MLTKLIAFLSFASAVLVQGILWQRIPEEELPTLNTPFPIFSPVTPRDCRKEWAKCTKYGQLWFRRERVVDAAQNGGKCELRYEKCAEKPTDCIKEWGKCIIVSDHFSYRQEQIIKRPTNGGACKLNAETDCAPVDCGKKWGPCTTKGTKSERTEVRERPERNGGECTLRTETGCRLPPIDCKKGWSPCRGSGKTSSRKETVKVPPRNGGKPCGELKTEMGCNPTPDEGDENDDDSKGKATATLFIKNLIPSSPKRVSSRHLVISPFEDLKPGTNELGSKAKLSDVKFRANNTCRQAESKGAIIGSGCDVEFDESVKKEVDKEPIRGKGRFKRNAPNPISRKPRDVLFLLDSSGSVGPYRFGTLQEVCKAIVELLCGDVALGEYKTRVALGTFNARQLLHFPFTTTSSVAEVKRKIENVKYDTRYSYQSCLKGALKDVVRNIYTEENNARDPDVAEGDMIIMTDGCANCNPHNIQKEIEKASYRLKVNFINVYVIGIGIDSDCQGVLQILARGGRCFHFFFLENWDIDVEDFLKRLKNPPKNRCLSRWEFPGINCLA